MSEMSAYEPKAAQPLNEPVRGYAPPGAERVRLERELKELAAAGDTLLTLTIGGARRLGGGERVDVAQPHHHSARLGVLGNATAEDVGHAVDAALQAAPDWRALSLDDRAAVFLKAAELLAGPSRETVVAATMLGQSKTASQAEPDVAALADAWRRNVHRVRGIPAEPPDSPPGAWHRADRRPLSGFVCAITSFDSTAVAAELATAPALLGNTVVWKPAPTQTLAAWHVLRVLEAAGLPPGVINMVTGDGQAVSQVALAHPALAGVAFAGSPPTFQALWQQLGRHLDRYPAPPRLVGATGGKGFVLAHPSADRAVLRTTLIRGAFDYQGQHRESVARAYLPRSVWQAMKTELLDEVRSLPVGDVSDLSNSMGALIDAPAYTGTTGALARARETHSLDLVVGGHCDDAIGYFVEPTVIMGTDPRHELFSARVPGPVLAIHVYEDARWEQALGLAAAGPRSACAVVAQDRYALARTKEAFPAHHIRVNGTPDGVGTRHDPLAWTFTRSISESLG